MRLLLAFFLLSFALNGEETSISAGNNTVEMGPQELYDFVPSIEASFDVELIRHRIALLGPRDTGGGNEYLLIFKQAAVDIIKYLSENRFILQEIFPRDFLFNIPAKPIKIIPGKNLEIAGKPVTAKNYPSLLVIEVDSERWERMIRDGLKIEAIGLVLHELLEVWGGLDQGQLYVLSSKFTDHLRRRTDHQQSFDLLRAGRGAWGNNWFDQNNYRAVDRCLLPLRSAASLLGCEKKTGSYTEVYSLGDVEASELVLKEAARSFIIKEAENYVNNILKWPRTQTELGYWIIYEFYPRDLTGRHLLAYWQDHDDNSLSVIFDDSFPPQAIYSTYEN